LSKFVQILPIAVRVKPFKKSRHGEARVRNRNLEWNFPMTWGASRAEKRGGAVNPGPVLFEGATMDEAGPREGNKT
jgi:hypothetical protein